MVPSSAAEFIKSLNSIPQYIDSLRPEGASLYMAIFLGVVLVTLAVTGKAGVLPEYLFVLCLFLFTIWYIYILLIAPNLPIITP